MNFSYLDMAGERIRVASHGGDGVPLVICNEIGANIELLTPLLDALGDTPWMVFDAPGAGESTAHRARLRMGAYARLLARLVDTLGYTGELDYMGIGWGGLLVQCYVLDQPQRVRRLVLAGTSAGQVMLPGRFKSLIQLGWRGRFRSADDFARTAHRTYGGLSSYEPDRVRANAVRVKMPSRRGYSMQLAAAAGPGSVFSLHRINRPTMILAGDDDPIVPMVNARILQALIPQSRLVRLAGAGHLFPVTRAAETARAVQNFCRRKNIRDELAAKDFV
jgi:poly(3-hydroxyalkanoate) depolymerase